MGQRRKHGGLIVSEIPPTQGSPYGGGAAQSTDASGFFRALFDFSFTEFITPKVVKFVYVLATVALILGWLVFLISGFSQSAGAGIFVLIGGAIGVILYLALIRMTLEFYLAIVRMSQDIHHRLPGR
jgi:hypothetical protein